MGGGTPWYLSFLPATTLSRVQYPWLWVWLRSPCSRQVRPGLSCTTDDVPIADRNRAIVMSHHYTIEFHDSYMNGRNTF
jgi:hypothetical protein